MAERRSRGVRLSELDRSRVYRLGWVGRRWEVLGPEATPGTGAGPATDGPPQGAEPRGGTYVPRHAAPAVTRPEQPHALDH